MVGVHFLYLMKLHHSAHLVLKSFLTPDFQFSFLKISIRITHGSENCVRNGFIKARGDEAVSGDSDYVHDDTFSEMEEGGMEEIPKEILNATDSFNVKSDEEFL